MITVELICGDAWIAAIEHDRVPFTIRPSEDGSRWIVRDSAGAVIAESLDDDSPDLDRFRAA